MPPGHDADKLRKIILDKFDLSLGTGLAKLQGKVFRIGHLGSLNDLMLAGTLAGVEMGLALAGIPHRKGGLMAGLDSLVSAGFDERRRVGRARRLRARGRSGKAPVASIFESKTSIKMGGRRGLTRASREAEAVLWARD